MASAEAEAPPHKDLVALLTHDKPAVRRIAVENVLSLTVEADDRRLLREHRAVAQLCRLIGDLSSIAGDALKALINLSDDPVMLSDMLKAGVIGKVIESLAGEYKHKKLAVELLQNVTRLPSGAKAMLQQDTPLFGLNVRRLIVWYLKHVDGPEAGAFDEACHIFENVTQLKAARGLFLDPTRRIFPDLLPELSSPKPVRRRGIAGFVKNCCFHEDNLPYLLSDEVSLLPIIMKVLMGREVYNQKERDDLHDSVVAAIGMSDHEQDPRVRRLLLEAMQVLASFRAGRDAMRASGVYHVIKKLHFYLEGADDEGKVDQDEVLADDDEAAVEAIINLVNFIQRDEADAKAAEAADAASAAAGDDGEGRSGAEGAGATDDDDEEDTSAAAGGSEARAGAGAGAGAGSGATAAAASGAGDAAVVDEDGDVDDAGSDGFGSDMDDVD